MEKFILSRSEKESGDESPQPSTSFENEVTKCRACPDLFRDLTDLASQVQLMSDSLFDCTAMSSYYPTRNSHDVSAKETARPRAREKGEVASHVPWKNRRTRKLQETNEFVCQEVLTKINYRNWSLSDPRVQNLGLHPSSEADLKKSPGAEKDGACELNSKQLIDLVQKELKNLMVLVPPVSLIITAISDRVFHYKVCARCSKKISSSLPWILQRIQDLILYVVDRRRKSEDRLLSSWLRPEEEIVQEPVRELGKSKKVDADDALEGRPGFQVLLKVHPEKQRKKYFLQAGQEFFKNEGSSFPVVQLNELSSRPVVQVLKSKPQTEVLSKRKQEVQVLHDFSLVSWFLPKYSTQLTVSYLVLIPEASVHRSLKKAKEKVVRRTRKAPQQTLYLGSWERRQEEALQWSKCFVVCFVPTTIWKRSFTASKRLHKKKSFDFRKVLDNAPSLVKELLKEAEEEKTKIKSMEKDVRVLKDLMSEVRQDQAELSELLLEKGIYSKSLVRLTSSKMLEEENDVVRRIAEIESSLSEGIFSENLQYLVCKLQESCTYKKRMLKSLIQGLQSNVPKEYWEEIFNHILDELKPMDALDFKKVNEIIRQTLSYLTSDDKAAQLSASVPQIEERSSEGKIGESETETSTDSDRESAYLTGLEDILDCAPHPERLRTSLLPSQCLSDPTQISTFIQNVLYQDSCAGVTVVDLFVAVKAVKDNLDFLSLCQKDISSKIDRLYRDSRFYREKYEELFKSVREFLIKMEEDVAAWSGAAPKLRLWSPTNLEDDETRPRGEQEVGRSSEEPCIEEKRPAEHRQRAECGKVEIPRRACSECGRHGREESEGEKRCCLDFFLSSWREKVFGEESVLSEALLGSFLASMMWLKKEQKGAFPPQSTSSSIWWDTEETGKVSLNQATTAAICDVCEASFAEGKSKAPFPRGKAKVPSNSSEPEPKPSSAALNGAKPAKATEEDTSSEADSDFEEALSSPQTTSTHYDLNAKPSVTCMGDLSKDTVAKKNEGTITSKMNLVPSWIRKLSAEISSKLKKKKSTTSLTILEPPGEKSKGLKSVGDAMTFTVTTDTPMGVFDVTVVQYRKPRFLSERFLRHNAAHVSAISDAKSTGQYPGFNLRESTHQWLDQWSQESFFDDSESEEMSSYTGDDQMEEFTEVFVSNTEKDQDKDEKKKVESCRFEGRSRQEEFKTVRTPFFEIQKCYPLYIVQNLIRKTPRRHPPWWGEAEAPQHDLRVPHLGKMLQRQYVVEGSSSEECILIQVEVEGGVFEESHGDGGVVRLREGRQEGESLYSVWKGHEASRPEPGLLKKEEEEEEEERVVMVKEPNEKVVAFDEKVSEILIEKKSEDAMTRLEEIGKVVEMKDMKQHVSVWHVQNGFLRIQRAETRWPQRPSEPSPDTVETINANAQELKKALELIHEVENNIVEVKLNDAISILPRLEVELRKHLQDKLKALKGKECKERSSSLQNYFSAIDFWPKEEISEGGSGDNSEERLNNLLTMLCDLEAAVKSSKVSAADVELCEHNSSRIYKLLHALTLRIRELEEEPNMKSLSQTLDIASELDTAVREYDNIIKRQPLDYVASEKEPEGNSLEEVSVKQHLKNVRKRVFEMVEDEAVEIESRIERDFDRLDRLERENDEVLMFLEAFLKKTERRVVEFGHLKRSLKSFSESLNAMYNNLVELATKENEKRMKLEELSRETERNRRRRDPLAAVPKESASDLLSALDNFKSRSKEKIELRRMEISSSRGSEKGDEAENSLEDRWSSPSLNDFEGSLRSTLKEFKKIGETSLYLAWTQPQGPLENHVSGYQIYVNDKLNQKVRNPRRLQAVLYSVDLSKKTDIQLYAITEASPDRKILLASLRYRDE